MLTVSAQTQIYIALGATDMRKGFDGLCGLVIEQLKKDPLCGALYLFINKRRDRMKVLYWDGDGLAIWYRRLEQGTFRLPKINLDTSWPARSCARNRASSRFDGFRCREPLQSIIQGDQTVNWCLGCQVHYG